MALTTVKSDQIQTSVALAGSPTTTTQSASDNSTKIATTAYADTAVANLVASAPSALNTLDELAAALNDDASFSTTVTNSIATKLPLAGGTMSGALNMGSQNITNAGTIAGTLTTAAQTNITSVGTLTGLTMSGNLTVTGQSDFRNNSNGAETDGLILRNFSTGANTATALKFFPTQSTGRFASIVAENIDGNNNITLSFLTSAGNTPSAALTLDQNRNATFSGNVGIGGGASDGNLHIRKTGISTGITNVLMNANFADGSNGSGLSIGYRTDETTAVIAPRTATGNIAFYAYNNSAWFEAMRMSSAGNFGIGESNPDASLHITSNTPIISFDETDASKEFRIGSYGGAFAIRDETSSAYRVVVNSAGNVGIGTSNIDAKLHIEGNSDNGDAEVELVIEDTDTTAGSRVPAILFKGNGSTIGRIRTNDVQGILISGGSTMSDDLVITNSGVGIGTTNFSAALSLGAVVGPKRFLVYDGVGGNNLYAGFGIDSPVSNDFTMYAHNNGRLNFGKMSTNGSTITSYMKLDSAGPLVSNGGSTGSFTYNVVVNKASGANDSSYNSSFSAAHTISSSVSAPMEYFKTVALINTRAYHNYVNIKTNLTSNGIMLLGHFLGYMYGYGNKEAFVGGYTHTNNSLISQYSNTTLQGTGTMSGTAYRASDGAICFKIHLGHTSYTEGQLIFRFHSHSEATTRACTVVAAQVRNDGTNHYA